MKTARELTHQQLAGIVGRVQALLYLDRDAEGRAFWNPAKRWNPDGLAAMARTLAECGLVPTAVLHPHPPPVPAALERLVAQIEDAEDDAILDELVIDLKYSEASTINNAGVPAQVKYLVSQLGTAETVRQVSEVIETRQDEADR